MCHQRTRSFFSWEVIISNPSSSLPIFPRLTTPSKKKRGNTFCPFLIFARKLLRPPLVSRNLSGRRSRNGHNARFPRNETKNPFSNRKETFAFTIVHTLDCAAYKKKRVKSAQVFFALGVCRFVLFHPTLEPTKVATFLRNAGGGRKRGANKSGI